MAQHAFAEATLRRSKSFISMTLIRHAETSVAQELHMSEPCGERLIEVKPSVEAPGIGIPSEGRNGDSQPVEPRTHGTQENRSMRFTGD